MAASSKEEPWVLIEDEDRSTNLDLGINYRRSTLNSTLNSSFCQLIENDSLLCQLQDPSNTQLQFQPKSQGEWNALNLLCSPDPRGQPVDGVLELMHSIQHWSECAVRLLAALINSRHGQLPQLTPSMLKGLVLCLANAGIFTLNLYNHGVGDSAVIAIASSLQTNSTLTTLHLHGNLISESGSIAIACALESNTAITTLNISNNRIGDVGSIFMANSLKTNSTLTTLNLCDNEIGNAGCTALAKALAVNSTLTTLQLCCNRIGDEGCIALATALKINRVLSYLYLQRNQIQDGGCVAVAEALTFNVTVTTLHLSGNQISDAVKPALRSSSPRMKRVGFDF